MIFLALASLLDCGPQTDQEAGDSGAYQSQYQPLPATDVLAGVVDLSIEFMCCIVPRAPRRRTIFYIRAAAKFKNQFRAGLEKAY